MTLARHTGSPPTLRRKGCESQIEAPRGPNDEGLARALGREGCEDTRRSSGPSQFEAGERSELASEGRSIWQSRSKSFVTCLASGVVAPFHSI